MPKTLVHALRAAGSTRHKGYTFLDGDLNPSEWSFEKLVAEAERRAAVFQSLGLNKGDRLAMVVPDGEDFILSFFGAVLAGVVPVPMYPPLALGKLDAYVDSAASVLRISGARMLLTTKQVSPILWSLTAKVKTLEDIVLVDKMKAGSPEIASGARSERRREDGLGPAGTREFRPVDIQPEDTCFLQFTSGSTAQPKGVMVTHANLAANAKAIMFEGLKSDPHKDRGVSWLPLYHDMGLIGFVIAPIFAEVPVVFLPTLSFVKRPGVWMETIDKYRGTITFGPNFALGLAAKRAPRNRALDLSCLRVLGCGAEPINPKTMSHFLEAFAPHGFQPPALMPAYGMAEATLAMAFDDLSRPLRTLAIDRGTYEAENRAQPAGPEASEVLELVSCGRTFPGHEIGIMAEDGRLLAEGEVGEIVFRGPSVTAGYFQNPEATTELLKDGWLHTGDLGFIQAGEVFISGRKKDLIILNGRNYYPQSIEWVAEQVPGVRRGNVVAFSVEGENTERLVLVAEANGEDRAQLSAAISAHVKNEIGVVPEQVLLVPKGAIPKTSSGKLQRRKTREQFLAGTLGKGGSRVMGSAANRVTLFRHMTSSVFARMRHRIRRALPERMAAAMGWPRATSTKES